MAWLIKARFQKIYRMRIAVITDIHGNWDALVNVLEDIEHSGVDKIFCLGDNIGYGPEPNRVIQTLRDCEIPSILGNHELAVLKREYLAWFNPTARRSLEKTIELLSDNALKYLSSLERVLVHGEYRFVHGFPPESLSTYRYGVPVYKKRRIFETMEERICFIGHTHDLNLIAYNGETLTSELLVKGSLILSLDQRYIISAGSVGQPRDGNNNAKYVIWDESTETIEVRYIPYDITSVAEKIIAAGFPGIHAKRLL